MIFLEDITKSRYITKYYIYYFLTRKEKRR